MSDIVNELRQTAGNLINGVIEDGEVSTLMLAEAADELDTALTRIRELEGAFAALGDDPATPAWIQTFARALSSKDQEKTNG